MTNRQLEQLMWMDYENMNHAGRSDPDPDDVQDLIAAYRSLRADHAALRAAVVLALGRVGNLRVVCPELAGAVEPKGGES